MKRLGKGNFRKATEEDVKLVAEIYDNILTEEEAGNVTIGWLRGVYPTEATARQGVVDGDLFVLEDEGVIVAAAKINQVQVPEYVNADWEYSDVNDDEIMVLHTLVVEPKAGRKGYGKAFVNFYEEYALAHGCHYLRMDTNERNANARRLYKSLGYSEPGIVDCVFNGIPGVHLVCLEKKI